MAETPVEQLTEAEAREELARLTAELTRHDAAYHQQDAPEISDADYDALKRRALAVEDRFPELTMADSPSQVVGAAVSAQFSPVRHGVPMLSLDNAFDEAEVADFEARIRRFLKLPPDEPVAFVAVP
jgi:DNA ligase (NAD+)